MAQSIPISQIVTVNPAVVTAGANPLALNTVILTESSVLPTAQLLPFYNSDDVGTYFGTTSTEYALAVNYFLGFENSTKKPQQLFFYQYSPTARGAWLRSTSLAGMTLTQLQAVTGTLSVTIDGVVRSWASVNLAGATSFSNAATLIASGLLLAGGETCTWDATLSAFVISSGTTGATSTITLATGTAAASLGLAAGITSQGKALDTPAAIMGTIKAASNNWACFMLAWDAADADSTAFAVWSNSQGDRYLYIAWDNNTNNLTANNALALGSVFAAAQYDGVIMVYNTANIAAFVAGTIGCIDWNATNGRITAAFKTQSGLATSASTLSDANNLLSNYANYYGVYSAPGPENVYNIFYNGKLPGKWKWLDTYVNQIFLNAQLQSAIFVGLTTVNAAPYNELGYSFIRAWCTDPIVQALNNGTIRTGVPLSSAQKAAINSAAGLDISNELQNNGYYLQVLPATAQVRQARTSPPVNLWYMDGGAIQQISLASIAVL